MQVGYDVFGKAYGVMLRNDLHSVASIDHHFLRTMVLLDDESYAVLYKNEPHRFDMSEHELYDLSQRFMKETAHDTIDAVLKFTNDMAMGYNASFEDMLFGGTEKQILERGTDWCADMARVCCVILKCLNIPCRILHVVNLRKAYNGHVVCEAFYENGYGVIDPIYGYRFYKDRPISGYDVLKNRHAFSIGDDSYMDLYGAIAINEYDPLDEKNDYSVARPNAYYLKIIGSAHHDQWFLGEE